MIKALIGQTINDVFIREASDLKKKTVTKSGKVQKGGEGSASKSKCPKFKILTF